MLRRAQTGAASGDRTFTNHLESVTYRFTYATLPTVAGATCPILPGGPHNLHADTAWLAGVFVRLVR